MISIYKYDNVISMKTGIAILFLFSLVVIQTELYAVETAPRISDREIVERLTRLEEGQKAIEKRLDDLREDMNKRFEILMWMIGIFVSASFITLGFVIRMQWQMNKRLSTVEATLTVQRDEILFLKTMVEKLITSKSA